MTSKERIRRMFAHQEADRIAIVDFPWQSTLRRWRQEGLPAGMDWSDYFGIDKWVQIGVDISPQYPCAVIEEDETGITCSTPWGAKQHYLKKQEHVYHYFDFKVTTPEAWEECKARMLAGENRIDWKYFKKNFPIWQKEGRWIAAQFFFGFNVTQAFVMGMEDHLCAMYEEPEMIVDMYHTFLDCNIRLYSEFWDAGYHFDCIRLPEDMGYKGSAFFSNELYRELLKPVHKRAVDWAHNHGIYAYLHSDGYIMTLLDDVLETGIDALNPIERKAGMDLLELKHKYGSRLAFHGGIDAESMADREAVSAEILNVVPKMKENGGYIFGSDHSVPDSISLEAFQNVIKVAKEVGKY